MADEQWHLDKRVPIALILAILIQSGSAIWWASTMSERMNQVERRLDSGNGRNGNLVARVGQQGEQIAVLSAELRATNAQLERLYKQGEQTQVLLRSFLVKTNHESFPR